MKFNILLIFIL